MDTKKQALLNKLYKPYHQCLKCPLGSLGRTHVVFGEGNPNADLMLVGEGPGRDEDLQGRPFVGRSGKLLSQVLEIIGAKRTDIFITNVVKCRPPGNRKPLPKESGTCKNLLLFKQIDIIKPRVICTLGAAAIEGFTGNPVKITQIRGHEFTLDSFTLVPTFHPAYILRNPSMVSILTDDLQKALLLSTRK